MVSLAVARTAYVVCRWISAILVIWWIVTVDWCVKVVKFLRLYLAIFPCRV